MFNIIRSSFHTGRVTEMHSDQTDKDSWRGRPIIDPGACSLSGCCANVCPSNAITIMHVAPDALRWQLDIARCVFCGLCEEACPNGAIKMDGDCELAVRSRENLVVGVTHGDHAGGKPGPEIPFHLNPTDLPNSPIGHEAAPDHIKSRIRGVLRRSLHVRHMAAGSDNSCDWEIAALLNPIYDIQRLGIDFVASPRHADLLLVTGAVTRHLEAALLKTYEAMPSPRLVVAAGDEACGGGVLQGSYAVAGGVDRLLPVDVFIPGDPPRPEALIYGLLVAVERLEPKLQRIELMV